MRTRVWDAQDALLAALRKQRWPDPVVPVLGTPPRLEKDAVWVAGEVSEWARTHPVSGNMQSDESFQLRVFILVTWLGGTFADARGRLSALGALVESALADHTLGGEVAFARIESQQVEQALGEDGRRQHLLLGFFVRVDAWLPGDTPVTIES